MTSGNRSFKATIPATWLMSLNQPAPWVVVAVSVGPAADPILLLWAQPPPFPGDPHQREYTSAEQTWRDWEGLNRFRILHYRADRLVAVELPETEQTYHHVQPLPGGEYVLVAGWANGSRPNADVYDAHGQLRRSWHAGNCVTHFQTTPDGRVWVGYCGRGYFESERAGNYLSRNGAACFDEHGTVPTSLNLQASLAGVKGLIHCWAMNVVSNAESWLWASEGFGNHFSLFRVTEGRTRTVAVQSRIRKADAFAVAGNVLLTWNRLGDESHLNVTSLDEEHARRFYPVETNHAPLQRYQAFGRGSRLYLWTEHALLVVDAASLSSENLE